MELTNGKILWPLDKDSLNQRFENKDRFIRELGKSSSYEKYRMENRDRFNFEHMQKKYELDKTR